MTQPKSSAAAAAAPNNANKTSSVGLSLQTQITELINYCSKSGFVFVYALGICIVTGKHFQNWNTNMPINGLWMYFVQVCIAFFMTGTWACNFAEMVSIVPFSGGCYGYSRVALGPFMGYIAGMMEIAKYLLYNVLYGYFVAIMFQQIYLFEDRYLHVIWLGYYIFLCAFLTIDKIYFQIFLVFLAMAILTAQYIFVFGAVEVGHQEYFKASENEYNHDGIQFMRTFSSANYLFGGVDAVRTGSSDQSNAIVPWAMVNLMIYNFFLTCATILAARAYVPKLSQISKGQPYAYNKGLILTLRSGINSRFVSFFSLPGIVGAGCGFLYTGARQTRSMAASGLLPSWLAYSSFLPPKNKDNLHKVSVGETIGVLDDEDAEEVKRAENSPVVAMIVMSILSVLLLSLGFIYVKNLRLKVNRVASIFSAMELSTTQLSYIIFKNRFSAMNRSFVSPIGSIGAVLVIIYFHIVIYCYLRYENDNKGFGYSVMIFLACCIVYYFLVVQKRQFFSKEEQDKFIKAYITNANRSRRKGSGRSRSRAHQWNRLLAFIFPNRGTRISVSKGASNSRPSSNAPSSPTHVVQSPRSMVGGVVTFDDTKMRTSNDAAEDNAPCSLVEQSKHNQMMVLMNRNLVAPTFDTVDLGQARSKEEMQIETRPSELVL